MKSEYLTLHQHPLWQRLYEDSPVADRIKSIRRRLATPACKGDDSMFLKGELTGLLEVQAMVEALADGEEIATGEGPQKHTKRLLEFAGFRDRFSARAS